MDIYFLIGVVLGLIVFYSISWIIAEVIDKHERKKYREWWDDPSTERFIYDSKGNKIWSNKRGCIGKSTHFD